MTTFDNIGGLSAVDAVREAFSKLLVGGLVGRLRGGDRVPEKQVRLKACYDNFPTGDDRFDPPCAALTEISSELENNSDLLEEVTFEDESGQEHAIERAEVSGELSVDLWASNPEERKALKAAFPAVFSITDTELGVVESNSARGITLELSQSAIPPMFRGRADFRLLARISIEELPRDIDESLAAMRDEWRAQGRVSWESYVATAADVERMNVVTQSGEVTEPGELTEAIEAEGEGR